MQAPKPIDSTSLDRPVKLSRGASCFCRRMAELAADARWPVQQGIAAGFANTQDCRTPVRLMSVAREIEIPWIGEITDRVVLLNFFDRTNLIRPPSGIGVFQSATVR